MHIIITSLKNFLIIKFNNCERKRYKDMHSSLSYNRKKLQISKCPPKEDWLRKA